MIPDRPPNVNMATKLMAYRAAVVKRILPPHRVEIQLKILTPVGTAISIVAAENRAFAQGPIPTVNMW